MTIVIFEENSDISQFAEAILKKEGLKTRIVKDMGDIPEIITLVDCRLIVIELVMSDKSIFEITGLLREKGFGGIPVLVVLEKDINKIIINMLNKEANIKGFIYKPIKAEELLKHVHSLSKVGKHTKENIDGDGIHKGAEKIRKHERYFSDLKTDIFNKNRSAVLGGGYISDFSTDGVAVTTKDNLEMNNEFYFRINLSNLGMDFSGRVVRKEDLGGKIMKYGIKYTGLNLLEKIKFKTRIKNWLKLKESLEAYKLSKKNT